MTAVMMIQRRHRPQHPPAPPPPPPPWRRRRLASPRARRTGMKQAENSPSLGKRQAGPRAPSLRGVRARGHSDPRGAGPLVVGRGDYHRTVTLPRLSEDPLSGRGTPRRRPRASRSAPPPPSAPGSAPAPAPPRRPAPWPARRWV